MPQVLLDLKAKCLRSTLLIFEGDEHSPFPPYSCERALYLEGAPVFECSTIFHASDSRAPRIKRASATILYQKLNLSQFKLYLVRLLMR